MRITCITFGLGTALLASSAMAHTITVGTCQAGTNNLPTIGAAVAAIGANGTIKICPGIYPEQVFITRNMKLVGLAVGNSSYPSVTAPSGGLATNTAYLGGFPVAAQIVVQGAANVSVSNLTVDGSNNGINGCTPDIVGIYYQNAGGMIAGNAVINQSLSPQASLGGCQSGEGIFVESNTAGSSGVAIKGNVVANFQKTGIIAANQSDGTGSANARITGNTVLGQGATPLIAANSIEVDFGGSNAITGNIVGNNIYTGASYGSSAILVYASAGVTIAGNRVSSTQYGIVPYSAGTDPNSNNETITGNVISQTVQYDAIDLCNSSGNTVTSNTINVSGQSAIHLDSSCGTASTGNTVSGNMIDLACAGILVGPGSSTPGTNTILNTATQVLTNSDVCPVSQGGTAQLRRLKVLPLRH